MGNGRCFPLLIDRPSSSSPRPSGPACRGPLPRSRAVSTQICNRRSRPPDSLEAQAVAIPSVETQA